MNGKEKEVNLGKKLGAFTVYVILEFSVALLFSLIFTVNLIYHVTVVKLTPLQLVLVGTILEGTVFLFEIPTGVMADVKSRRLSVIIGYVLMGLGFIVEGSFPVFGMVALAQVLWGFGYTFTSGATQAWIVDEIGTDRAGDAFLRGSQAGQVGALIAIPISVALGSIAIRLPIVLGGVLMVLLAVFLALAMTEEGFTPTPPDDRTTWGMMLKTMRDAQQVTRRHPVMLVLLGIGLFFGLYSEGFDRLWTAHLLENFAVPPWIGALDPVVWFGIIQAVLSLICLAATEITRRRVDTNRSAILARVLMWNAGVIVLALAGFGLTRTFWVALVLYWVIGVSRSINGPLYSAWFNQRIDDPQVRATMFSVSSQVDAVGQITGGPIVGMIGNVSIRAALATSAFILSPVLPLYSRAIRRSERPVAPPQEEASSE
ncbi:MAG: MFS transporter [Chloroflexi bacterium]|nr:MFS transporter [Chloroflexota bacterium]